tara:strand:- start:2595 stop:3245 length:651 start_codon:yes stop_codon:yes gene_type:complete
MNLIILNKSFGTFENSKESIFYHLKVNQDYKELKKFIEKHDPENIISIDFGVQANKAIKNNTIVIGKESIMINSKPIDWSIPRADKWLETSERLNLKISNILEENCLQHIVGSCAQLEYSEKIKERKKALEWIHKKIKVNIIDNNSVELLKIIFELNLSEKYSFLRLINSKYQINNNNLKKIKNIFYSFLFNKFHIKKISSKISEKKLIIQISKIN